MRKLNAIPFSIYTHANQYVLLYLKDHVTAPQFAEFSSEARTRFLAQPPANRHVCASVYILRLGYIAHFHIGSRCNLIIVIQIETNGDGRTVVLPSAVTRI